MWLLLITILGTAIGTMLAVEAKSWMPYLSARLVRSTLDGMPADLDGEMLSRWREEIEGDLNSYLDRPLAGLLFSLRLRRRGGRRLAAELLLDCALVNSGERSVAEGIPATRKIIARFDNESQTLTYEDNGGRILDRQRLRENVIVMNPSINRELRAGKSVDIFTVGPPPFGKS
jgi:hypothetical protein